MTNISLNGTPPLSPRSLSTSPRVMEQKANDPFSANSLKLVGQPLQEVIPQVCIYTYTVCVLLV